MRKQLQLYAGVSSYRNLELRDDITSSLHPAMRQSVPLLLQGSPAAVTTPNHMNAEQGQLDIETLAKGSQFTEPIELQVDAVKTIIKSLQNQNIQEILNSKVKIQLQVPQETTQLEDLEQISELKLQLYLKICRQTNLKFQLVQVGSYLVDLLQFDRVGAGMLYYYVQALEALLTKLPYVQKQHLYILLKFSGVLARLSQQHYLNYSPETIGKDGHRLAERDGNDPVFTVIHAGGKRYKVPTQLIQGGPKAMLAQLLQQVALLVPQDLCATFQRLLACAMPGLLQDISTYPKTFFEAVRQLLQLALYERLKTVEARSIAEQQSIQISPLLPAQVVQIKAMDWVRLAVNNPLLNTVFVEEFAEYNFRRHYLLGGERADLDATLVNNLCQQFGANNHNNATQLFFSFLETEQLSRRDDYFGTTVRYLKTLRINYHNARQLVKAYRQYFAAARQHRYKLRYGSPEARPCRDFFQDYITFFVPIIQQGHQNLTGKRENAFVKSLLGTAGEDDAEPDADLLELFLLNIEHIEFCILSRVITRADQVALLARQFVFPQSVRNGGYQETYRRVFDYTLAHNHHISYLLCCGGAQEYAAVVGAVVAEAYARNASYDARYLSPPEAQQVTAEEAGTELEFQRHNMAGPLFAFYERNLTALHLSRCEGAFACLFHIVRGRKTDCGAEFFDSAHQAASGPAFRAVQLFVQISACADAEQQLELTGQLAALAKSVLRRLAALLGHRVGQIVSQHISRLEAPAGAQPTGEWPVSQVLAAHDAILELGDVYARVADGLPLHEAGQRRLDELFGTFKRASALTPVAGREDVGPLLQFKYYGQIVNKQEVHQALAFLGFLCIKDTDMAYERYSQHVEALALEHLGASAFRAQRTALCQQMVGYTRDGQEPEPNMLHKQVLAVLDSTQVYLRLDRYLFPGAIFQLPLKALVLALFEMGRHDGLVHRLTAIYRSSVSTLLDFYQDVVAIGSGPDSFTLNHNATLLRFRFGPSAGMDGMPAPEVTMCDSSRSEVTEAGGYRLTCTQERKKSFVNQYFVLLGDVATNLEELGYHATQTLPFYGRTWFEFILSFVQASLVRVQESEFRLLDQPRRDNSKRLTLNQAQCYQVYCNQAVEDQWCRDIQVSLFKFKDRPIVAQVFDSVVVELYMTIYDMHRVQFDTNTYKLIMILYYNDYKRLAEQFLQVKDNHELTGSIYRYCVLKDISIYSFFLNCFAIIDQIVASREHHWFAILLIIISYTNTRDAILHDRTSISQFLRCDSLQKFQDMVRRFISLQINILNRSDEEKINLFRTRKTTCIELSQLVYKDQWHQVRTMWRVFSE